MHSLKRQVGLWGALLLGLGSMIGTGVYAVIPMVAASMGSDVIVGVILAALLAVCNGLNSAQLAAAYPVSGGTYEYGYRLLTPAWGFSAGWMFLLAKSASAATAALALAYYIGGEGAVLIRVALALGVLACMTWVVASGIKRTNTANVVLVGIAIGGLLIFLLAAWNQSRGVAPQSAPDKLVGIGWFEACAWLFVAYTGYGRIATLGEEIHDPHRNITRAMCLTLGVTALIYILVAATVAAHPQFQGLTSLRQMAGQMDAPWVGLVVAIAAGIAMLGATLNLLLGLSRMLFAMARRKDMPATFAQLDNNQNPRMAVFGVAAIIAVLILLGDLRTTWAFSAFTVLIYYGVCNLAALRLRPDQRIYPRWLAQVGLAGCVFLALQIHWEMLLTGIALLAVGIVLKVYFNQKII